MNDSSTLVMEYRDLPKREGIYGKTSVEATLPLSRIVNFADFQNKIISERFYVMSHHVTCSHRYTAAKVIGLIETAKLFAPKFHLFMCGMDYHLRLQLIDLLFRQSRAMNDHLNIHPTFL